MPHCVHCKTRTTEYVVLPKLSNAAIQSWIEQFHLDRNQLSNGRNVICRSHLSPKAENKQKASASGPSSSSTACEFDHILLSMGNVNVKTENHGADPVRRQPEHEQVDQEPAAAAEALPPITEDNRTAGHSFPSDTECPVCLQAFSHPIKLPCGHIFCYLCAKGFVSQNAKCAFCRADIPRHYMNLPELVRDAPQSSTDQDTKYLWYYEGRNGWWQFEERHCDELEKALEDGCVEYEIQIAGFMYTVDMNQMIQFRRDRPERTRRIKRDHFMAPKKGIAGLREDLINGTLL